MILAGSDKPALSDRCGHDDQLLLRTRTGAACDVRIWISDYDLKHFCLKVLYPSSKRIRLDSCIVLSFCFSEWLLLSAFSQKLSSILLGMENHGCLHKVG
jgi:hypothetical protein